MIDDIHVDFDEGLTIITGETGAGKSILLGALSLILGRRADLSSIKNRDKKCIVEAVFTIDTYNLNSIFTALSIDYESDTILRREILPSGKSRAFINDSPVNLGALENLGKHLIDVHSQHQNQELTENTFQIKVLDAMANNQELLNEYQQKLHVYKELNKTISELKLQKSEAIKEQDYNAFLVKELVEAQLVSGDQEQLEAEQETLSNVEDIKQYLQECFQYLSNDQIGILNTITELRNTFRNLADLSSSYTSLYERIESVSIELDDIYLAVEQTKVSIDADPERLLDINSKLSAIQNLLLKHSAQDVDELIAIKLELEKKVTVFETIDDRILELENEGVALNQKLTALCKKLHDKRLLMIPKLVDHLEKSLGELGMPNAKFNFNLTATKDYYQNGFDHLELLFTANKGDRMSTLKKVASGGELSRIMLTIKSILAEYDRLPTIIFDEIDSGVSGEVSKKMGEMMFVMGKQMQVFAITHLPQIAAKGAQHFKVYKSEIENKTRTQLLKLNVDQRIAEIAEMLEGKKASSSAIAHAKQLLN